MIFFSLSLHILFSLSSYFIVSVSRSLLLYALNILLILHLSLYLPLFKFPIQATLTQLSHSFYFGLRTFLSPSLLSYSSTLDSSFLLLCLCLSLNIITPSFYDFKFIFLYLPSLSNQMYPNPILYN